MAAAKVTVTGADSRPMIDRMTEHDLLEVVEIEEVCGLSPWGWDAYHRELQSPEDVIMLVARKRFISSDGSEKLVTGFIVARLIVDELHINNIAVRPDWRRIGIGAGLLESALAWGREKESKLALLEVRAGNNSAQALYRRCGFELTGRRRGYYRAPLEDALIMSVSLK